MKNSTNESRIEGVSSDHDEGFVIEGEGAKLSHKFNLANSFPQHVQDEVLRVLKNGRLYRYDVTSPDESEVSLLEREFAQYIGTKYAVAFNSCSSAIFTSLLCANVKPGDKVFMPAFTFIAVPSAIVHAGAIPVMINVRDDYCIDIVDFNKKISEYPDAKTLLLSHMRGHVSDMDKVTELCKSHGVTLIEDSAHALGTKWRGQNSGTFGQSGCFSAQSYKMIDGGEGGFLVTNDDEIAAKAILYSGSYEAKWKTHFYHNNQYLLKLQRKIPAFNFRMSMLSASVIRPQIVLIDDRANKYNNNYFKLIAIISQSDHINVPVWSDHFYGVADSIQFNLVGLSKEQKLLFISTAQQEGLPISLFGLDDNNARCFWGWEFLDIKQDLSATKEVLESACDMRLPLYLSYDDIEIIGNALLKAINHTSSK
jgi:perosamine synthetase